MYTLGVDVGATSVKVVALEGAGMAFSRYEAHKGAAAACARRLVEEAARALAGRVCAGVALTGSGADALRDAIEAAGASGLEGGVRVLEEVPAATLGAEVLAPQARSIMCIGGQSALFVALPAGGGAPTFSTNDSCASGTGSFFEDQMARLGLAIEDYSELVSRATSVPRLSGRCTVFAKTDIIHRQQEGVAVEDILLGLCYAMVKSFKATIVRGLSWAPPLALAGGVVKNAGVVRAVREVFKLGEGELLASPDLVYLQAAGTARAAWDGTGLVWGDAVAQAQQAGGAQARQAGEVSLERLAAALGAGCAEEPLPRLEPLPRISYEPGAGYPVEHLLNGGEGVSAGNVAEKPVEPVPCALGVDVGSTSTNLVLVDLSGNLLDAQYLRTRGNPRAVVAEGLASIGRRLGERVRVVAAGTTGSGRSMIGEMIGADVVRDEITAQARAAAAADPQVDTVFEIGGQDSKYIRLAAGQVSDFQMNKVCAAGTGSFVEEQAARLGIPLSGYGELALSATQPVDLGERCTVFVETAIHTALARGAALADVAAGLCQSIVRNYLYRVVGTKPVGSRIVLQGGVAYNPGIVAAFKQFFGDALTVSPWFAVSGAVGVALLALEEAGLLNCDDEREHRLSGAAPSAFRGFFLERAASSHAKAADAEEIAANRAYFRRVDELYLEGYDPVRDPAKKTVGIPRCLMMHKLFPMANAFFRTLGYNVVLTDASNEETVRLSQQVSQGEVCYPLKLVHGHMMQLLEAGVDYVFFPSVHTIRHLKSKSAHNYACTYMQTGPRLLARELEFEKRGVTLLSPLFEMDWGQEALANALLGVGEQLGHSRHEAARAMLAGGFAVREFTRKTEELGEQLLNGLEPDERVIVLITRQYGILDPALNMGIADALLDRGQKVIMVSHLHAHDLDISRDYPGVYWPFGQHIISGAKLVRRDPRLFAVYLTNHGCGPDTMVSHYFRDEMGDKPYLQIEMDEHYSKVGVITRLEAFLNAISHYEARDERLLPLSVSRPDGAAERVRSDAGERAVLAGVGLLGRFAARAVEVAAGVPVSLVNLDARAVEAGRRETESKEYLTFAAFLGAALQAADERAGAAGAGAAGAARGVQLLMPSTEGAEADGQYDRVTRVILDEKGARDVRVVAPKLEQLPWVLDDAMDLFTALLAADVCYAAPAAAREGLAERLLAGEGLPTLGQVEAAAREVRELRASDTAAAEGVGDGRAAHAAGLELFVVGEWPLVYADDLTGGVLAQLEREGMHLSRMPFSEYLLFLWRDAVDADRRERDNAPFMLDGGSRGVMQLPTYAHVCPAEDGESVPHVHLYGAEAPAVPATDNLEFDAYELPNFALPAEEKLQRLQPFFDAMARVSAALGKASPFDASFDGLRAAADAAVGQYRGANGRYRAAKTARPPAAARGTFALASMYENTDIMLKLREGFCAPPIATLHLEFDGVLDKTAEDKIRSFLYYL